MKRALLSFVAAGGGFAPFRTVHRRQVLVVTYHRFTPAGAADAVPGALPADALAAQLDYLTRHYRVVPLRWIAARIAWGESLPSGLAAISVDDGYADVCEVALPLFQRFRVPATVFLVTGFLDGRCWIWTDTVRYVMARSSFGRLDFVAGGHRLEAPIATASDRQAAAAQVNRVLKTLSDAVREAAIVDLADRLAVPIPAAPPPEMRPMTWPQARALVAAGIDIGSHTMTHPMLTRVGPARLADEVETSRRRLHETLSVPIDLFCYPNGGVDAAARAAVARAGYMAAVTTVPGFNDARTDPLALRRIHTERTLAHFVQSTSGFEQVKARWRAGSPGGSQAPGAGV